MVKMEQQPLSERLKIVRERCRAVPGGIKAVAKTMGRVENTLHNWFKGKTTPTVEDVELLIDKLEELERVAEATKKDKQDRMNAALA